MATKIEVLSQADKIVSAQIAHRRPPMFETLKASYEKLGDLTGVVKALRENGDGLPSEFSAGITDVIRALTSFRSGYASNDPAQAVGPGIVTKRASLAEFVNYVKTEIEKSAKEEAPEALARLRAVSDVIKAGLDEIAKAKDGEVAKSEGVSVPVTNDAMQVKTTETAMPGAKDAAGTSSASTAASNFATNPGDINAGPPSTAPNAATGSVVSTAGTGTGGQAQAPFTGAAAPAFQSGSGAGAAASTSGVAALAGGATNSGDADVTKAATETPEQIAKRAEDELAKGVEEMRKAAEKAGQNGRKRDGWTLDLNSREFLSGTRTIDFGSDSTPPTK